MRTVPLPPAKKADEVKQYVFEGSDDELIKSHLRLAATIVLQLRVDEKTKEEIVSDIFYRLVKAVRKFLTFEDHEEREITPYLITCIKHAIKSSLKRRKKHEPLANPCAVDHVSKIEVQEVMRLSCRTNEETRIFYLIFQEYNDREIGELIGRSIKYVWKKRQELFLRFQTLWNNEYDE